MIHIYERARMYVLAKPKKSEGKVHFLFESGYFNRVYQKSPVLYQQLRSYKLEKGAFNTKDLRRILFAEARQFLGSSETSDIAVILDLGKQESPLVFEPFDEFPKELEIGLGAKVEFYFTPPS